MEGNRRREVRKASREGTKILEANLFGGFKNMDLIVSVCVRVQSQ